MADDKEVKYILYYKGSKTSETQTSQLSNLIYNRSDDTDDEIPNRHNFTIIDRSVEYKNLSAFNDTSIVVQRKKKHRYKNFQATIGISKNTKNHQHLIKQYSSPLLHCRNNYNMQKVNNFTTYHEPYHTLRSSRFLFSKKIHKNICEVYRCQFSTQEESCCCSCNSDAMFEVMKSLYDCYKKKNCDHCNCILCGHLPREERRLGELRKAGVDISTSAREKAKKKKKVTSKEVVAMLEGKTPAEKEKTLKELAKAGISLPEPRTISEEALIAKVKTDLGLPSEPSTKKVPSAKLRKAKELGLLTPLEGKSADQKEKILRGLAMNGIPLPKGKTDSERKLIDKVRTDVGMPPEPKSMSQKKKFKKAMEAGLITPLEGKTRPQKENILKQQAALGIPLPQGRTASEKSLIAKIQQTVRPPSEYKVPSEKIKKAKEAGLLTPLEGKTPAQKEKILKGLAMKGIPLPPAKTESDRNIIDKVRKDLALPPEPRTSSEKNNYKKALAAGIITPLEGKTAPQKAEILKKQAAMGIPLPEGRTSSEKALIAKIQQAIPAPSEYKVPSEKIKKAKAAGLLTPLEGKTPAQKEKILKGLALNGIPLPAAKTESDRNIIDKVRKDLALPPEPRTSSEKNNYKKALAAGILTPLEGKTAPQKEEILKKQAAMGISLPEGRTSSEKALIAKIQQAIPVLSEYKVPSVKMKKAKAAGLLTPLKGKTPAQKEKILKGLALNGIPLPAAKTESDRNIIDKVRKDLALPPEPRTSSEKNNYKKALAAGIITPLEGKTVPQKEEILKKQAAMGIPLPEGRTSSEKALIAKVQQAIPAPSEYKVPSEKIKKAKAAGLLTPLEGKTPAQKEKILKGLAMKGIPLPPAKTESDRNIIDKVRKDLALPPEPRTSSEKNNYKKALAAGIITPLEGKTAPQKEEILKKQAAMGIPLPEGRTPSEKALISKVQQTIRPTSSKLKKSDREIAELLTKLEGKPNKEKQKILKAFAMEGKPLPEARTASEKKIIDKIKQDLGIPLEPKSHADKEKYKQAVAAGIIVPLEGKSAAQKEKILQAQADMGIELPEGRTASEKAIIKKIKEKKPKRAKSLPPEKIKKLDTKTAKVMKEGKGPSDECICDILTPESEKVSRVSRVAPQKITSEKLRKAKAAGLLTPLQGKTAKDKERILKGLAKEGLPLPEPKTASEKQLMEKIKAEIAVPSAAKAIPSEKLRKAKAAGLLTPLQGKPEAEKEKIIRGLAQHGIPLPQAQTASEKKVMDKVRKDLGLPPEPKTQSLKEKYQHAQEAGLITPLEGKSRPQKEKILTKQAAMGIPLPEGRTQSEKDMINRIRATVPKKITSEKLRRAKAAGLLTPLEGKTPKEKERILKSLVKEGLPLPEPKTASVKQLIAKVKTEMGVPVEGISSEKLRKAKAAGLITPLQGKSQAQKEKILKGRIAAGMPLPEGVTSSDKELIQKVKAETGYVSPPLEKRRAPTERGIGIISPLKGKTPSEKEAILKNLAKKGIPLPEPKTVSDKAIVDKVIADLGKSKVFLAPPEKLKAAKAAGFLTPLEGKTDAQKQKILAKQAEMGIPLPEGRTQSEKDLINKIRQSVPKKIASEKLRKAKEAGLLTPLQGKSLKEKEKIIKGLAKAGLPLPEGKTQSEKQLIKKVKADIGLPAEEIPSEKLRKAMAEGLITPLGGKSQAQKEKILRGRAAVGLPLPEGVTSSDKELIKKVKADIGYVSPRMEKKKKGPLERVSKVASMPRGPGITPAQKEKILKELAIQEKQLPQAKTSSEIKILDKVRRDLGLPPEPKSQADKEKYNQAVAAGIIVPLEGKSAAQKEKILQAQVDMGLELPEGRTASEKAIIKKIKAQKPKRAKSLPPEKIKKLDTKTAKVMKEGKGPSDECICDILTPESEKVSRVSRVAPQKVTSEKLRKAKAAGLLTPLQGKTAKDKERILKGLAKEGLPLPEPKTASEKQLMEKIKAEIAVPSAAKAIPSEKLRKAKAAGLLTPLQGKPEAEKEKIIRGLAQHGIPLPQAQTASEKKVMDKVRKDLGLPPEPKTRSLKEKYQHAQEAGLITPLEGKSRPQKEKILTKQVAMGIPLPEGRTQSEKDMINRIRATVPKKITSEKLRKAKAAGLLTPLEGKTPKEKERILKSLAKEGLPLPEPKTASEKQLIAKVKTEMGVPVEGISSEKLRKAKAAGLITPLEGKSLAQKEKILKGRIAAGLPLPEGVTSPDKELIKKVKAETGYVSPLLEKIPSEKIRKAKAAGLLTPLQGKPEAEKEKILRGLAQHGIPLPQAKTASEKKIMDKVRKEIGLPPEPKSPSLKEKYRQAQEAGFITPLEGKSAAQKEKMLTKQAEMGITLPEGRTKSEKDIINRIRAATKKLPSEMKADIGGKTIKAKTSSEKEVLKKAKAEGLLTPLRGKSPEQKEKILKGLAEAGLPMPEAKTASEKALVEKVRTALGLPLEPTPSEKKGKIKTKSKKTGVSKARKSEIGVGVGKSKVGITEEFEDIIKTTTCDRGCGCDRKKIRFKHSYVKIRVTSPDISSLCPCPEECIPGVKGGVFTDSEGIKVTVGQVSTVPSFQSKEFKSVEKLNNKINEKTHKMVMPTPVLSATSLNVLRSHKKIGYDKTLVAGSVRKVSSSVIGNSRIIIPSCLQRNTPKCRSSISDTFILIKSSSDLSESELSMKLSLLLRGLNPSLTFTKSSNLRILSSIISFSLTNCSSHSNYYLIERNSSDDSVQSEECTTEDLEYSQFGSFNKRGINSNARYQHSSEFNSSLNDVPHRKYSRAVVCQVAHDINKYSSDIDGLVNIYKYVETRKSLVDVMGNILLDPILKNSSSLYVILPTSSDDDSSIYSIDSQFSSTICIQLSQSLTNWNNNCGPRINYPSNKKYKKPRGLRIAAKGRNNSTVEKRMTTAKDSLKESVNESYRKNSPKCLNIEEEKQEMQSIKIYEAGTDTTIDRPCCCKVESNDDVILQILDDSVNKISNNMSELIVPLIINEAVAQGFSQDNTWINDNSNNRSCPTTIRKICINQTPVRHCKIPPCSGYTECHPNGPYHHGQYSSAGSSHPRCLSPPSKQCECDFKMLKEMVEKIVKEKVSTACGSSRDIINMEITKPSLKNAKIQDPPKMIKIDCGTCSKPNLIEPTELLCVCRGQKKKITIGRQCPCEEHASPNKYNLHDYPESALKPESAIVPESKSGCKCKRGKKSKNIICECPQDQEPPEDEFEPLLWIDERQLRKMKSDLTQTMSGFKINKARKSLETEMSFEEALEFFEIHQDEGTQGPKTDLCLCDDERKKKRRKEANCECPYSEVLPSEKPTEEPFRGIKFHIDGKGSMSRGLSGVLCFELLEH